jgi:hypothetical protein
MLFDATSMTLFDEPFSSIEQPQWFRSQREYISKPTRSR